MKRALRDRRLELWQRRLELGERLGSATVPEPRLLERADAWLLRTQGAFESLAIRDLPRLVEVALASAAHASYPSRLSLRSLVELLDATRWFEGLELDVELPERIGPASFARGLAELGAAFRYPDFHDRVLENGAVTLPSLRGCIGAWLDGARTVEAGARTR